MQAHTQTNEGTHCLIAMEGLCGFVCFRMLSLPVFDTVAVFYKARKRDGEEEMYIFQTCG
jgi:hypothetical protein